MTLGQKLKKLRNDKGLTQKELAEQLHVTFQTISKWESDKNEPDISTLKELSKFYGCSFDYLLSEEEPPKEEVKEEGAKEEAVSEPEPAPAPAPVEAITKTIVIHQNDLHVCAKCGKDIPEEELASEDITKRERHGRITRTVSVGQTFYHKGCLELVKRERAEASRRAKAAQASRAKKICFGWGIAAGIVALGIALAIFLNHTENVHWALGSLFSVLIGYAMFSMIYCILCGSYIGEVFLWCSSRTIRFPGLIFSWSLDGFMWLIGMKILFAILGFLAGLFFLVFAIVFSSTLSSVSFPFILIHNIYNDYEDCLI